MEECGQGMQEALRRRRRTLIDCSQLQSSNESIIEFTAPPSSSAFPGLVHPAESEVIELLKMAFMLQVSELYMVVNQNKAKIAFDPVLLIQKSVPFPDSILLDHS